LGKENNPSQQGGVEEHYETPRSLGEKKNEFSVLNEKFALYQIKF